jgi:hypothetical protein
MQVKEECKANTRKRGMQEGGKRGMQKEEKRKMQ